VVYVIGEGGRGVKRRVAAWSKDQVDILGIEQLHRLQNKESIGHFVLPMVFPMV
jgi:hypothetical protein